MVTISLWYLQQYFIYLACCIMLKIQLAILLHTSTIVLTTKFLRRILEDALLMANFDVNITTPNKAPIPQG